MVKITNFILRLPKDLLIKIDKEAKEFKRSRNGHLEYLLESRYKSLDYMEQVSKNAKGCGQK